jgi:hypothetical protein
MKERKQARLHWLYGSEGNVNCINNLRSCEPNIYFLLIRMKRMFCLQIPSKLLTVEELLPTETECTGF